MIPVSESERVAPELFTRAADLAFRLCDLGYRQVQLSATQPCELQCGAFLLLLEMPGPDQFRILVSEIQSREGDENTFDPTLAADIIETARNAGFTIVDGLSPN